MTQIADWVDTPKEKLEEKKVQEYLNFRLCSARYQAENRAEIDGLMVFAKYQQDIYRITGASRLGDIYLAKDPGQDHGYDTRVNIMECYEFSYIDNRDA